MSKDLLNIKGEKGNYFKVTEDVNGDIQITDNIHSFAKFNDTGTALMVGGNEVPIGGTPCEAYGASPSASASVNTAAINSALANGGFVSLVKPGVYVVDSSLIIPSNTEFYFAPGVVVRAEDGRNYPVIRNEYDGYIHSADKFSRASSVCTVVDAIHPFVVGDTVFVGGGPDSTYDGLVTVTGATAAGWSYANTGSDDAAAGTSGQYYNIIPIRRTLAGTAFVATTGEVVVTDPGHDLHAGDQVYLCKTGGSTICPGLVDVIEVSEDAWHYYVSGASGTESGTIGISYDRNIKITGRGYFDGNRVGVGATTGNDALRSWVVGHFGNVSGLTLDAGFIGSPMRGASMNNCVNVLLDKQYHSDDVLVAAQFEGGGRNLTVDCILPSESQMHTTSNQQSDDFVAFTGTKYAAGAGGNYDNVISPYGLTYYEGINIRQIVSSNCLNGIKITAHADCPFIGNIRIGRVSVRHGTIAGYHNPSHMLRFMDDGPGLVGTTVAGIIIDGPVDWATPQGTGGIVSLAGAGSLGMLVLSAGVVSDDAALLLVTSGTVSVDTILVKDSIIPYYGANKPAVQLLGGTINKLILADSTYTSGTSGDVVYLAGATLRSLEFRGILLKAAAANTGSLFSYATACALEEVIFNGILTDAGASAWPAYLFKLGNINVGTLKVILDKVNVKSASGFTVDTGGSGTVNVHCGDVTWTATGGNNFAQVGSCTWNLHGGNGVKVADDKLFLFGYGSPVRRLNIASQSARVNMNSGNYTTGLTPVAGDMVYNSNAGTIPVGLALNRAGTWGAL